jgi:hypothetical protein
VTLGGARHEHGEAGLDEVGQVAALVLLRDGHHGLVVTRSQLAPGGLRERPRLARAHEEQDEPVDHDRDARDRLQRQHDDNAADEVVHAAPEVNDVHVHDVFLSCLLAALRCAA